MDSRNDRMHGAALLAAILLAFALDVHADDDTWALDRADFYVGSYVNDLSLKSQVSGSVEGSGTRFDGTQIDFSRDFDAGGSRSILLMGASWRPFERHQFSLDYFSNSRERSARLQRDIEFDNQIFPVNAAVSARFEYELYEAKYTYWAWVSQRDAFGISTGLADYRIDLRLSGSATIDGTQSDSVTTARAGSDVPAPLIGLDYRHAFTERLRFFADASAFKARINRIDGRVASLQGGVEYFPWEHVGVAALGAYYRIDADVSRGAFHGNVNLCSSGFQLLVHVRY